MKNLKKLTKGNLKSVCGGAGICPSMMDTCEQWCNWTPWQKSHCILGESCTTC